MIAPVYRNIDSTSTLLGLAFPLEVLVVLGVFWASIFLLPTKLALAVVSVTYVLLRLVGRRRPPQYLQHQIGFHTRRILHGSTLSGACRRHRVPRFPFGSYVIRDVPRLNVQPELLRLLVAFEPHPPPVAAEPDQGAPGPHGSAPIQGPVRKPL